MPAHSPSDAESDREPTRLVGGDNFSSWPQLKWARANAHLAKLQTEFNEWVASAPAYLEGRVRDDRETIDLVGRIPGGVPTALWALTLGDAVHSLRSAFDAVAWGMANFDGAEPLKPRQVQFPFATDVAQWKRAEDTWVGDVHAEFRERIWSIQPFRFEAPNRVSVLTLMHQLDIDDKHRDVLRLSADLGDFQLGFSFELEDEDAEPNLQIDMSGFTKFEDGAVIGQLLPGARIRSGAEMRIRPEFRLMLSHEYGEHEVFELLYPMFDYARRCLDRLLFGSPVVVDADAGGENYSI